MRSTLVFFAVLAVSAVTCNIVDPYAHKQCQSRGHLGYCNSGPGFHMDKICADLKCATKTKSGYRYLSESIGPAAFGTKCGLNHICNENHECVPTPAEVDPFARSYNAFGRNEICKGFKLVNNDEHGYRFTSKSDGPAPVGTKCGSDHVCNAQHKCVPTPVKDRPRRYICKPYQ
ncbi:uncharacterized protein [Venturia canescens]|uniref:uncharacterized protein n=1 Tax=Venturia canescens TaxID=32260 RepID=UPI001C9CAB7E|nr:uncharacterized protein LOC122415349 [Venturia canescens]